MSYEIAELQNKFPHHSHWAWKALNSVNFGQRNLGAKWEATTARAPRGLGNYSPQLCNQWTIHWCRFGFRIPWEHKKRTQPDKKTIAKKQQQHFELRKPPLPPPPTHTHHPNWCWSKRRQDRHCEMAHLPDLAKPMRNRTEASTAKQHQQRQAPKRRNSD